MKPNLPIIRTCTVKNNQTKYRQKQNCCQKQSVRFACSGMQPITSYAS